MNDLAILDRIRGSLLGGAAGDALGTGVAHLNLAEIRQRFGTEGIADYAAIHGRRGVVSDVTQMTLFTGEGLLRAWVRQQEKGICHIPGVIHHAYLRWLLTQAEKPENVPHVGTDGWLYATRALHIRRSPGTTCIKALKNATGFGEPNPAHNHSKGCGGVMRVAPIGLFASVIGDDDRVFELAVESASLTHGHRTGSLCAGYLAVTIAALMRNETLGRAFDHAARELRRHEAHKETAQAVEVARTLAEAGRPSQEQLEGLGGGWIAEEALAIAVCCSLVASDFADGVMLAVNHSGDSDSTGAIAGNLLGAQLGIAAVPWSWLQELELYAEIDRIARDLEAIAGGRMSSREAWTAYPGW